MPFELEIGGFGRAARFGLGWFGLERERERERGGRGGCFGMLFL